jgi:galactose mutarotase-like enzyme
MLAWSVGAQPLLWTQKPAIWPKSSPILFPTVGRVRDGRYRLGGKSYELGVHGFAAASTFAVEERRADGVRLVLVDDAATRAAYPFAFRFAVEHRMRPDGFATTLSVENTGAKPLPYACGVHPGICWPFAGGAKEDYAVVFEKEEAPNVPAISPDGLFTATPRAVPLAGRRLPLSAELMSREALCFLDAKSRGLSFVHASGAAVELRVEDLPHLALWSKAGAPFLCLEAWTGYGDPVDFAGELTEKPSMRLLAPGAKARHAATYAWRAAG